jgi:hypothetical protein
MVNRLAVVRGRDPLRRETNRHRLAQRPQSNRQTINARPGK